MSNSCNPQRAERGLITLPQPPQVTICSLPCGTTYLCWREALKYSHCSPTDGLSSAHREFLLELYLGCVKPGNP